MFSDVFQKQISLPEDFASNVLHLRDTTDSVFRSNKGGWQSDRCKRVTHDWAIPVVDAVKEAAGYTGEVTYWFNVNKGEDYNEWHDHDKGDTDELCACLYIQIPEGAGNIEFERNKQIMTITPQAGLVVVFPDDIMHRVLPNQTQTERISMAFNFWKMLK